MKSPFFRLSALALCVGGAAIASAVWVAPKLAAGRVPTYARDVAPILQENCQTCHRAGGIAPFPLTSYADAFRKRNGIRRATESREMPPWHVGPASVPYMGDPSLAPEQIRTLARWIEAGAPEGSARDLPAPKTFREDWELGRPDLVLEMPEPFRPDFSKGDVYQCYVIPTDLEEDRWVEAVEIQPGNRSIVHHALVYIDESNQSLERDRQAPGLGYPCLGGPGVVLWDRLAEWAPGQRPQALPTGVARFLPKGSRLILQAHYSAKLGKVEPDASRIGLFFAKAPVRRRLWSDEVGAADFIIPAGARGYTLRATKGPLGDAVELIGVLPHMHLIGKTMKLTARLPDGQRLVIVNVRDWDIRWQRTYLLETPLRLPQGTYLDLEATYDNSSDNPFNPHDPPVDVYYGDMTENEMCLALMLLTIEGRNPGDKSEWIRGEVCGPGRRPTPQGARVSGAAPPLPTPARS